ncbi:MAG: CHASE3 domain-containing protein, partial [Acidobacteriota bacterium]|nr:CHASE3 domain-containing protein [Acidobacteriota bacterium]
MANWSVGTRIGAGYAFALALLALLGVASYRSAAEFAGASKQTVHTHVVLDTIGRILSDLQDAETGQRGYVITGVDSYLEPYRNGVADLGRSLRALRTLTADNPAQQQRIARMEPLVADKLAELKQTIELRRDKGFDAALQVVQSNEGKKRMDEIRATLSAMKAEEERLLKERDARLSANSRTTIGIAAYGVPLAVLVLAAIGFAITRAITRQLRDGVARLAS